MSVIEYKINEHAGGFVGFRAERTIGIESDRRCLYFSLNEYNHSEAKKLALECDNKWKAEANLFKKENKLSKKRRNANPNVIVDGFRAYIDVQKKKRAGKIKCYFSPVFLVKHPGHGKPSISFRINKYGYRGAFMAALKKYSEIHGLTNDQKLSVLAKIPDRSLFYGYLLKNLRDRGHVLTKNTLSKVLDVNVLPHVKRDEESIITLSNESMSNLDAIEMALQADVNCYLKHRHVIRG